MSTSFSNTFSKSKYFEKRAQRDPIEEAINWANSHLAGDEVEDLSYDFCDGTNLCKIIESVTQKPFPMQWVKNPQNVRDKRRNIGAVLTMLRNGLYIKPGSVKPDEILWGDLNSTYNVLRAINIYMDHGNLPVLPMVMGSRKGRTLRKKGRTEEEDNDEYEYAYEYDENGEKVRVRRRKASQNQNDDGTNPNKTSRFAVGIDLGTTFTRYSVFHDDKVDTNCMHNVLQSAVVFDGDDQIVGVVPISCKDDEQVVIITALKRIIGRDFSDPGLADFLETLPYKVQEDPATGRPVVEIPGKNGESKTYSFEQLTAMLLSHIKKLVSDQMGEEVKDAVISVPAYFTNVQRRATVDAARIAGLNVLRIVTESSAVAASYNLNNLGDEPRDVVVYDMGGGKLDVSLMHLEKGQSEAIKNSGNTQLGGMDFDNMLAMKLAKDFNDEYNNEIDPDDPEAEQKKIDVTKVPLAMRRLIKEAEKAKIALSTQEEVDILIPNFYKERDLKAHLTRDEFEEICKSLFDKCTPPLEEIFTDDCELKREDIKTVVLSGGSTRMPRIRSILKEFFGEDVEFFDIDENGVVAGLAMQGAHMKGQLPNFSIKEAVALSLGISQVDGRVSIIIPRGSKLPSTNTTIATTYKDNQKNVGFDICEGERPMAEDNIRLGHVTIAGIQQAPRGVPKIEVSMTINEDGLLVVTGKDLETNASVTVNLENKGNLSQEEVDKMLEIANQQRQNDDIIRRKAEVKTELTLFIDRAEKTINDKEKTKHLTNEDIEQFKKTMYECRDWIEANPDESPQNYQIQYNTVKHELNRIINVQ